MKNGGNLSSFRFNLLLDFDFVVSCLQWTGNPGIAVGHGQSHTKNSHSNLHGDSRVVLMTEQGKQRKRSSESAKEQKKMTKRIRCFVEAIN